MSTKIDFSKMERLTPRADSWDKVCARLDAEKAKGKIVSIKSWYSAIPLAASFVLVSLTETSAIRQAMISKRLKKLLALTI